MTMRMISLTTVNSKQVLTLTLHLGTVLTISIYRVVNIKAAGGARAMPRGPANNQSSKGTQRGAESKLRLQ